MKNYISSTFLFTLIVVLVLLALYFLPSFTWKGEPVRKVDLLSDIRMPEPDGEVETDTLISHLPGKPVFIDTCKTGMTCIEDYADSTCRGMERFYASLNRRHESGQPVRVAVFGDSFIEADIFTGDLRSMLQSKYGGCGVGFVSITSMTNGYRPTVRHSFGGWTSHLATDTIYFDKSKQGISSGYFVPHAGAYVEIKGQTKYALHLDTCEVASLYFAAAGEVIVTSSVNGGTPEEHYFEGKGSLGRVQAKGRIGRIRWTVQKADSALFYGVAMDGKDGICVDNLSLRGSSGLSLRSIPERILRQFNRERPYDLIILQYGLNVATAKGRNYDKYKKGMLATIEHLKSAFPQAGILLLSVGDRDYRTETGELRTMPGVKNLIRYQQAIAAESHVAFWNMFEAMGGEGSMAKLVHAKPSMANYDYTHINFRGGKHLAGLLYETLVYGKEQYDKRNE